MGLNLEELHKLKAIIIWSRNNAYTEATINNLIECERFIQREINLKEINFVTGVRKPYETQEKDSTPL